MKFNDFWQENKRFVSIVAAGAIVFAVGWVAIDGALGDALRAAKARERGLQQQLGQPQFSAADQAKAQATRDQLAAAVERLSQAVTFVPRPEFALDEGSASTRLFNVVSRTRDELLTLAGRAGLSMPQGLGMPALSPTKEQEIARYLEALDVVDRVARLAIEAQCSKIDDIRIKLDPRLLSGKAIADVERTSIEFELTGAAAPLTRLIALTQEPRNAGVLLVQRAAFETARIKSDEAKLELAILIAHLHGDPLAQTP